MPEDVRRLFELLKVRAYRIAEHAMQTPTFH